VTGRYRTSGNAPAYDVDPSGRFIMVTEAEQRPIFARQVNIVSNWFEELKRLVPTK
jgi:hypothetical protein